MERVEEEEEEEWEEQFVYVDLVGMVDPDKLNLCNKENTSILVSITFTPLYHFSKETLVYVRCNALFLFPLSFSMKISSVIMLQRF